VSLPCASFFLGPAFGIFDEIKSLGLRKERCRLKRRRYECNTGSRGGIRKDICRVPAYAEQGSAAAGLRAGCHIKTILKAREEVCRDDPLAPVGLARRLSF